MEYVNDKKDVYCLKNALGEIFPDEVFPLKVRVILSPVKKNLSRPLTFHLMESYVKYSLYSAISCIPLL